MKSWNVNDSKSDMTKKWDEYKKESEKQFKQMYKDWTKKGGILDELKMY